MGRLQPAQFINKTSGAVDPARLLDTLLWRSRMLLDLVGADLRALAGLGKGSRVDAIRTRRGRRQTIGRSIGFLLELSDAHSERLHDLRKSAGAKDDHDDYQNDDQLLPAKS